MEHRRRREKLFFLMFAGAIGIILLVMGGYQLMEFMDSTAFCGRLCHQVMYPEYTTYQASPHSRVTCSEYSSIAFVLSARPAERQSS